MAQNAVYRQKTEIWAENSLYSPRFEHDNCGIGAVVNIKGIKSHATVDDALTIVETLEHRAGKDADGKTGDGVGILLQIPLQVILVDSRAQPPPAGTGSGFVLDIGPGLRK